MESVLESHVAVASRLNSPSSKSDWKRPRYREQNANRYCGWGQVAISPDAQLLVTTSSDKTAKVWSIDRGWQLEKTLAQHQRWVWDACFSADSAYLVTASSVN